MPAASTSVCEQCSLQPSKYTCPTCKFRTCSLACTQSHKASHSSTKPTPTTTPSAASTSASTPTPKTDTTAFVPMTAYTEETMMSDYLFLSSISRKTSETGRNILSMNLLPPPPTSTSAETHHKPSASSGGGTRMTNQQRQREQLVKQLHYRRFKVMILPDGMARRKMNASGFVAKEKKFVLSIELTFPRTAAKVVHKQDSASTVEAVILLELQNRSFANKKDLSKIKGSLTSTAAGGKPVWIVSTRVLSESNLVLPKNAKPVEGEGTPAGESLVKLQSWPEEWAVLVPAYSARLTNESTTRYLEWWSRKRKWEEANPGLAEEQRLQAAVQGVGREKGRAWEGKGRGDGGWGRKRDREGEGQVEDGKRRWGRAEELQDATVEPPAAEMPQTPATTEASTAPTSQSLISNTLLSMLSQRLGRASRPDPSLDPPSMPALSQPAPPSESSPQPSMPTAQPDSARSILTHITAPHRTTLSWLLQTLPDGYSVVEFPELRIVPSDDVKRIRGEKGLEVVELVGEGEEHVEREEKEEAVSTVTQVAGASLGSLGLLAGYGSESDTELEEQVVAVVDEPKAEPKEEDGEEASTVPMNEANTSTLAQLARQHGFLSAPHTTT
ncbi:hypothetical protein PHSY_000568 [Pseudozyma hubeiensis SY62]|uniref:HIT-type domain-containing protein n=1 Tax=Pseudozyma hubeiensis (strain SY62) TaxID=1305764 RepID=R9NWX8_PSEHS|nr:hypothetical protein PHSY_000568 [Pseudozyma hubeiensis SY62]GAC93007.1 hypothetical protein PHSY_000568 [Pseudozyma hubeiensis SY62]